MNKKVMSDKLLLRQFLIEGNINQATADQLGEKIREACGITYAKRATWSNWISGRYAPNRWCKDIINKVLTENGYSPIYMI